MVKTAVYLAGFYFVYFAFLSRDTHYGRNRTFILLSVILSFVLPLISFKINQEGAIAYFGKTLQEVFVVAERSRFSVTGQGTEGASTATILFTVYITGVIILGFKLLHDTGSLLLLIARHGKNPERLVRFKGLNTSGFSAMGYVFINQALAGDETEEVIRHEMNHLKLNHYADIFIIELVKVLQWFNPAIYLINRSIRAIHEYQADEGCLSAGISVINYQNLLLNHIFRSRIFTPSNSFSNPSLIRKRITMMTRERSGAASSLKMLLVIPVVGMLMMIVSSYSLGEPDPYGSVVPGRDGNHHIVPLVGQYDDLKEPEQVYFAPPPPPPPPPETEKKQLSEPAVQPRVSMEITKLEVLQDKTETPPSEVFVVVEEMPAFPGGDKAMMEFIYNNIVYPAEAKEKNIQGRVVLRFVVKYNGEVGNVQVIKGVDPLLDKEAQRVIENLPGWKPGRQGGKPVNVWYSVPVTFQLK
jgi:TonB family protein